MDTTATILIAVVLFIVTFFFYHVLTNSSNYWSSRGIPSVPGTLPIFGNTFSVYRIKESLSSWCRKTYEKYPGKSMVGFYNMNKPTLMLRDPELVKIVLQSSFKAFQHNDHTMDIELDPLLGRDIFFIRGQEWKDSRQVFASMFSITKLKQAAQSIEHVCGKLQSYLASKTNENGSLELDAKFLFSRYTTEVAATVIFSIDGKSLEDDYSNTLLEAIKMTMDLSMKQLFANDLSMIFSSLFGKVSQSSFVPPKVDRYFRKFVNNMEELRNKDGIPRNDVLQMMLDLVKGGKISREAALSHMFSFFIETYETSGLTASFAVYELAKHPTIQEALRKEIETVVARYDGRMTYEAISEMKYLEQVVSETLRLFSPVGHMLKLCAERYKLEGSDGLSLDVEPGTSVIIPVSGLHMDPNFWENPEIFDPDRFDKINSNDRHKFAFLPFGEGPRVCPGSRLAMNQIKAAIATIVRNYRIDLSPKMIDPVRLDPQYFLATAYGGIWIHLKALKS